MSQTDDIRTFVYKTVDDCPIHLDVYPVDGNGPSPILVCIHGGALDLGQQKGHRSGWCRSSRELCTEAGLTQVSIDYRLAPETKIAGIIDDLRDAWRWCHEDLPDLFDVDTKRIAVLGRSAGGYLTLMAGFCTSPRPTALVSLYGYGDITGAWYSEPSPFYLSQPRISTEDAEHRVVGSTTVSETDPDDERWRFYVHCRQHGTWIREVTSLDPVADATALNAYRPMCNISRDFPATLLVHGTDDTDVPYEQSADMAAALCANGVAADLVPIPGGAHAFDEPVTASELASDTPSAAARSFPEVVRFLGRWLNEPTGGETRG